MFFRKIHQSRFVMCSDSDSITALAVGDKIPVGDGLGEVVALDQVAAELCDDVQLLLGFHTLLQYLYHRRRKMSIDIKA